MEPPQIASIEAAIRQESRSLLQYVSESYPWSKAEGEAACAAVCAMAREEAAATTRVARWLAKQRVPVTFPGAYQMAFTTVNFVALSYLLPRLATEQAERIAALTRAAAGLPAGEGRALLQKLIDLKTRHLEQLRGLQATHTPPAMAS